MFPVQHRLGSSLSIKSTIWSLDIPVPVRIYVSIRCIRYVVAPTCSNSLDSKLVKRRVLEPVGDVCKTKRFQLKCSATHKRITDYVA